MSLLCCGYRSTSRPIAEITVGQKKITALFDSGAEATLLAEEAYSELMMRPRLAPSETGLTTANGTKIEVKGQVALEYNIAGKKFLHPTVIVAGLKTKSIIGADFMEKHGLTIDMARKKIIVNTNVPPEGMIEVLSRRTVTIPPRTAKIIEITTAKHEEKYRRSKTHLCVLRTSSPIELEDCLTDIDLTCGMIEVKNTSYDTVTLKRGQELSRGYYLNNEEIKSIDTILKAKHLEGPALGEFQKEIATKLTTVPRAYADDYKRVLQEFSDIFSTNPDDVGKCGDIKQTIRLIDNNKVSATPPYRLPHHLLSVAHDYVRKLLKLDIIRPSTSPFSSPLMLVKKPGVIDPSRPLAEQYRVVHDYRRVNTNTHADRYPMQNLFELIDEVSQGKIFTVIDLSQGFWNQELDEQSKRVTAFGVPGLGHFEYNRSAQGLCNSPSAFQRLLDYITRGVKGVYVYIDDVVIVSQTHTQHIQQLKEVLARFRSHGMKCRLRKLQLAEAEINYLGYNISRTKGIRPGLLKTEAIRSWQPPTSVKEVKAFLGLCSFFRRTIHKFATIASPLTKLTRQDCEWKGGCLPDNALLAFRELRARLATRPCLQPVDFNLEFIVTVDSSLSGIGAILSQVGHDGIERPCAYASRVLREPETRFAPTHLEGAGLLWSLKHFQPYLVGKHFVIRTDHRPLTALNNVNGSALNRLHAELQDFLPYTIKYMPGSQMPADGLSRYPIKQIDAAEVNEQPTHDAPWLQLSHAELHRMQQNDKYIKALVCYKRFNLWPASATLQSFVTALHGEVVFNKGVVGIVRNKRFLALCPHYLKPTLLELAHDSPGSGHVGSEKTLKKIQEDWFWPYMSHEVENYCRSCHTCQLNNYPHNKQPSPLEPLPPAKRFNARVHLDLLGPLPVSRGNTYVLVMSDAYSSWVEMTGIPNKQTTTVAKAFIENWVSTHAIPERINSDFGSEFNSKVFKEIAEKLGIRHAFSSIGHPRSAGQVESVNKIIINYIRKFIDQNHDWDEFLPLIKLSANSAPHSDKKYSPYFITTGRRPNLATTLMCPTHTYSEDETSQQLALLARISQDVFKLKEEAFRRQKNEFDKKSRNRTFDPGDLVYVTRPHSGKLFQKFQPLFDGPYCVTERKGHRNYLLTHEKKRKTITVHVDRLKLATVREQFFEESKPLVSPEPEDAGSHLFAEFERALRELRPAPPQHYDDDYGRHEEEVQPPEAHSPPPAPPDEPPQPPAPPPLPPLQPPPIPPRPGPPPRPPPMPPVQPRPPAVDPENLQPGPQDDVRPEDIALPESDPDEDTGAPGKTQPTRPGAGTFPSVKPVVRPGKKRTRDPVVAKLPDDKSKGTVPKVSGGGVTKPPKPSRPASGVMTRKKTDDAGIKLPAAKDVPLPGRQIRKQPK